ncbi:MAG: translation initiation factor IF-2 [SAR202 cluster bacterium]|jgi:translation initiation factor IF-2|nr:translation initiation factor IF-2 [Chloroflexota bacterium]MDP7612454.1 translation initiation factor IF-2 [Dehalococcoidia bacterium]MQG47006.1 translation initiation factor IF-2 [SAR202 cluster bacterium]
MPRNNKKLDKRRKFKQNSDVSTISSDTKQEIVVGPVELPPIMTVGELSLIISQSNVDTIKSLMRLGIMATVNETIEFDVAAKVAASFEIGVLKPKEKESSNIDSKIGVDDSLTEDNAITRPPIITVLGHVDHGKTTLLDRIRGESVVDSEAGGITQGIGAYQTLYKEKKLTFIDTPGHQAFTSMRANGVQVTDIAILVVAADDGVMPQTIEAIDHSKAAGVPMVIAINKIDATGADVGRLKGQLAEHDIVVEDYGGDVVSVEISALKGDGIDSLLDSLLLVAEIEELKGNPERFGVGVVIESLVEKSKGVMATILVKSGTIRVGDYIISGTTRGRIKTMVDGFGKNILEAGPSTPVKILGLNSMPLSGDQFDVVENDRTAREIVASREKYSRSRQENKSQTTMEEVLRRVHSSDAKELRLVIKTGTYGSVDAVNRAIIQLSDSDVQVKILRSAAGSVSESDVMLASASDAMIVGFETSTDQGARSLANNHNIVISLYDIIYNLVDDIRNSAKSLLDPSYKQSVTGHALVQEIFPRGKRERIAGIRITDGIFKRNSRLRVIRSGEILHEGAITSMKHLSENVRELANNFEGGVMIDGFHNYEEQDILEAYELVTE